MKLVCESLYEFERGLDPKVSLGIGIPEHPWTKYLEDEKEYNIKKIDFFEEKYRDPKNRILIKNIFDYLLFIKKSSDNLVGRELVNNSYFAFLYDSFGYYDQYPEMFENQWPMMRSDHFKDRVDNYYRLAFKHFSPNKLWTEFMERGDSEGMKRAFEAGATNITSGKIKNYIVAIDNKDEELLKLLLDKGSSPVDPFSRQGRKEYNYPIRRAAFHTWPRGVEMLMADPRVRERLNSIPTTVKYLKNLNLI